MQPIRATEFQRQAKVERLQTSEAIARYLELEALPTQTASHYAAGVAQRTEAGWTLRGAVGGAATLSTPFDLASISKSIFAVTLSHLVRNGELGWKAPLETLLPFVAGTWGGQQTVEALLSHRSGLRAHVELFRSSWSGALVNRRALLLEAAGSRQVTPRIAPVYSDLGYILLGAALENLSGLSLDTLVSEVLCEPWGLEIGSARAFLRGSDGFAREVAPTENQAPRGGVLRGEVHDDNCWALSGSRVCGHAGHFGTLEAVLRFGALVLEGSRADSREAEVFEPLIRRRPHGTLRMGFDGISGPTSLAGPSAGAETFGHLGFTGTSFWCDPDRQRVTVLLSNRVYPTRSNPRIRSLRPKIHDFLWHC